ncbi:carboxymuconolactone decarboxylase family protein [Paraburkholderia strydomiana]
MAESPALLAGYSALWDLFSKSTLTPHEQQVVYLTSNFENNCHYCMAGHSTLAKMNVQAREGHGRTDAQHTG